jgi:hypothetical protein
MRGKEEEGGVRNFARLQLVFREKDARLALLLSRNALKAFLKSFLLLTVLLPSHQLHCYTVR